jgi:sensor domain CHASE-containing protein
MADRAGLKIVGFIFASITLAVMFTSVQVVKSQADSADIETTASVAR